MITQANGWMLAAVVDARAGGTLISAISFSTNVSYRSRGGLWAQAQNSSGSLNNHN